MTAKVLIRFMGRLIKDTCHKVFLILDNLRVHHARLVKAWVEAVRVQYLWGKSGQLRYDLIRRLLICIGSSPVWI